VNTLDIKDMVAKVINKDPSIKGLSNEELAANLPKTPV
jgi:ribosome-binding protein aMBF1 (putative translation factor)